MTDMALSWEESQLAGPNAAYLDELYEQYLQDPESVEPSVAQYFSQLSQGSEGEPRHLAIRQAFKDLARRPMGGQNGAQEQPGDHRSYALMDLVNAYRRIGHRMSQTDPLGLKEKPTLPELELGTYDLSQADYDYVFQNKGLLGGKSMSLGEIVAKMQEIYCGSVGIEYMHITQNKPRMWLREQVENQQVLQRKLKPEQQKSTLEALVAADGLEKYLAVKYAGQKRFALEGGDALIPLLRTLIEFSGQGDIHELTLGMAHRGRLNVLTNIMGKSPETLFKEFEGKHDDKLLSGDVKYHMGFSSDIETKGHPVHLSLAFNPSHLEIVAPVVEGSVRARQLRRNMNRAQVMAIHIHGDAAFAGQGVVMETLNMSQTRGFCTGGSIHIVINNQVGFTTSNEIDSRSTHYCTDVAKMVDIPVFHVNGDDPEAVVKVAQLAFEYRQKFGQDVVIDLVCYRRRGHNESDEPSATQPLMYEVIKTIQPLRVLYAKHLVQANIVDEAEVKAMNQDYRSALDQRHCIPKLCAEDAPDGYIMDWSAYQDVSWDQLYQTQVPMKKLVDLGKKLDEIPQGFVVQKQVARLLEQRAEMTAGTHPVNWGYAEQMAYATLVTSGFTVRLTGEDCGRGTFAHRHSVLHDQKTGQTYAPLNHLSEDQKPFKVFDSLLSEEAVLAFEYGFSSSSPSTLVIWEAQFGDFANTAQVVFDQFISSAEEKWGRLCGLVLYLPHGFEGMGAEHSSARLERQLQLCANHNMQVCAPTTPAQHYHMIRRQMIRPYRKPLIVMTPKSLLRHPMVTSTLKDLAEGSFSPVLDEQETFKPSSIKRVLLCQGKVYYDLLEYRQQHKIKDVAIVRIEQLYPFPEQQVAKVLESYAHAKDILWVQEEPKNQGAWYFIRARFDRMSSEKRPIAYVGRVRSATPAVGYPSLHIEQKEQFIQQAFNIKSK